MGRKKWEKKPSTMSLRRHRLLGVSGRHNAEKQQIARLENSQMEQNRKIKESHKGPTYNSISELMRTEKKKC